MACRYVSLVPLDLDGVLAASHRIDTHHHFFPPAYVAAIGGPGVIGAISASGVAPPWSVEADLAEMDAHGVAMSVLSISTPGLAVGSEAEAVRLARICNDYAADLSTKHPDAYRSFASIPLPYMKASLAEVDHALDALGACGICLMTNYGGKYLGDDAFIPLLESLNDRDAVVFVHPTGSAAPRFHPDILPSVLEFYFETSRTIASLVFARRHFQYPRIRFIFSHAGATMGLSAGRMIQMSLRIAPPLGEPKLDVAAALAGFYYDTAGPPFDLDLYTFLTRKLFAPDHLLLGTDYPFARTLGISVGPIATLPIPGAERSMIERDNAAALLRLGAPASAA